MLKYLYVDTNNPFYQHTVFNNSQDHHTSSPVQALPSRPVCFFSKAVYPHVCIRVSKHTRTQLTGSVWHPRQNLDSHRGCIINASHEPRDSIFFNLSLFIQVFTPTRRHFFFFLKIAAIVLKASWVVKSIYEATRISRIFRALGGTNGFFLLREWKIVYDCV